MSIYHSTPQRCTDASVNIQSDVDAFLSAGGEIEQIPTGQGAYNLQIREVKSRGNGTRRAWVDERLSMRSEAAKGISVRKVAEKKKREKARKR